ncbi:MULTISPECIES: hypothetical protein [Enterobacter]|uniref:hypothetical protein n=1 Tax=Enterobacter TaxID=547 RepID=UPI00277CC925|nr:hypothetical protein [Enterobacter hormaechei]MDY3572446.1 hypothetical protein [Enterobacter hormaechei]MEE4407026.1 hypothetical protein [Enterobacter mori]HDS5593156.1 hypothetical protein [Enterobacter hormaechei subsp. xiangfangensis]
MFFTKNSHDDSCAYDCFFEDISMNHRLMMKEIAELRDLLARNGIDADVVPGWYSNSFSVTRNTER